MNLAVLRKEIERDEGIKYEIYYDHLGYPTFGIGHFVKTDDPEFGQPIGFQVSEERVVEAFNDDMESVLKDCKNSTLIGKSFPKRHNTSLQT